MLDNSCLTHVSEKYGADISQLNNDQAIKPNLSHPRKTFIKPLLQDILLFSLNFY